MTKPRVRCLFSVIDAAQNYVIRYAIDSGIMNTAQTHRFNVKPLDVCSKRRSAFLFSVEKACA